MSVTLIRLSGPAGRTIASGFKGFQPSKSHQPLKLPSMLRLLAVRSRAVADLPPVPFARTSARPTSRALALPGNPIVPPGGYVSAPLRPPPSRAAVERWLVRKQRREERRKRRAARAARGPAAFRMNPNTGALIPVTTQKGGDASQASGGTDEGLEGQPDATPQSESSGSSGGSESEEGGAEQEEIVRPASPKYDEAQGLGTPLFAAGPSQRRRTSIASARQSQRRSAAGESQAEPLRPTSPKYDEAHGLSLPYLAPRGAPKRTFIQSSIPISVTQPAQTNRGPAFGMTSPPLQSPSFRSKPPPSPAHRGVGGFDKAGSRTPQSKTPLPFQRTLQPGESIPLPVSNITDVPQTPNPQQSRRANTEVPVPDSHTPQHQAVRKDSNVGHSNAPAATSLETARQDNSASNGDLPLGGRPPSESPFKIPPPPVRANSIVSSPKGQAPIPSSTTKPAITSQGTPPTLMQHSDVTRVGPGATSATGVPSPTSPGPTLGTLGPTMVSPKRDRSQITPPSPVGGGTPVSQVGFRDPAIAGGGQQLTLMSIEVRWQRVGSGTRATVASSKKSALFRATRFSVHNLSVAR